MSKARADYYPDLDGVRTLAVLMVVVHHWYRGESIVHHGGAMGVGLFFVLSGFLITNILFNQKDAFLSGKSREKINILKTFYIRRTLRIFPIYYLYITVLVALGIGQSREIWPWLYGYAYNFLLYLTDNWHSGYVEHLWSLAIEEQYYLIWPALLLLWPSRRIWWLILGFIGLAMAFRAVMYLHHPASQFSKFPICQFDGFGIGSALSVWMRQGKRIRAGWFLWIFFWVLSFATKWERIHFHGLSFIGQVVPLYYIGCAFLIYEATMGTRGIAALFFRNPAVLYLGKVSYGLYLYHLFVPDLVIHLIFQFGIPFPPYWLLWVIYCGVTLLITTISWFLIEKPINGLKDRFTYKTRKAS
jgi:peptidoglycan/LPS O-acetylase OafA/YrhL